MTFGLPMLILGGGGYRINNVARCWAYETGRILGTAVSLIPLPRHVMPGKEWFSGWPMPQQGAKSYHQLHTWRAIAQFSYCHKGVELEDKLPEHEYRDLFKPEDRLHISVSYEHENLNTQEYLDSLQQKLFNNLSRCGTSVQS